MAKFNKFGEMLISIFAYWGTLTMNKKETSFKKYFKKEYILFYLIQLAIEKLKVFFGDFKEMSNREDVHDGRIILNQIKQEEGQCHSLMLGMLRNSCAKT